MASEGAGAIVSVQAGNRVKYTPRIVRFEWAGAFEGYARGWVKRNFWRVRELLGSEEDAVQECALIFVRCKNLYEGKVTNPAWFMSLYKQAIAMDWITMSTKDSRLRAIPIPDYEEGVDYNAGMFAAALASSSAELQQLIGVIAKAPAEFLALLFNKAELVNSSDQEVAKKATASLNRRCKRLLGITNASADIISEMRAILSN